MPGMRLIISKMPSIKTIPYVVMLGVLLVFSCCSAKREKQRSNIATLRFEGIDAGLLQVSQPAMLSEPTVLDPKREGFYEVKVNSILQLWVSSPYPIELILLPGHDLLVDISSGFPMFAGKGSDLNNALHSYHLAKKEVIESFGDIYNWSQGMGIGTFIQRIDSIQNTLVQLENTYSVDVREADRLLKERMNQERQFLVSDYISDFGRINQDQDLSILRSFFNENPLILKSLAKYPLRSQVWSENAFFFLIQQPYYRRDIFEIPEDSITRRILEYDGDMFLKELLLANKLRDDLVTFETERMESYYKEIGEVIKTERLFAEIDRLHQEAIRQINSPIKTSQNIYKGEYDINDVLDETLLNSNGKVTYLDIWATWCRPCLEEFKISKDFKSNFNGEYITYVYVAAQSNEKAWRAMINKFELDGVHILLDKEQFDVFTDRYEVGFFPSYYVIDQNGKIVNDVANLSPSNPKTIQVITSLIRDQR
jgi:thiol-disulfide isomerase/thioredoxin